jgi:hypothetical protein
VLGIRVLITTLRYYGRTHKDSQCLDIVDEILRMVNSKQVELYSIF